MVPGLPNCAWAFDVEPIGLGFDERATPAQLPFVLPVHRSRAGIGASHSDSPHSARGAEHAKPRSFQHCQSLVHRCGCFPPVESDTQFLKCLLRGRSPGSTQKPHQPSAQTRFGLLGQHFCEDMVGLGTCDIKQERRSAPPELEIGQWIPEEVNNLDDRSWKPHHIKDR